MSKILKVVGASWLQTKISSYILGFLGVLAILALFVGQMERIQGDGNFAATVFYSDKTGYRIEFWGQSNDLADIDKGVARAYFRADIDTTGWSILEVETDGSYPDEVQAYAAGIVEGALTWYPIHTHLENTIRAKCKDQPIEKQCDKLRDSLDKSANVWKSYAAERGGSDPFWHHVSLYYTQIGGIFTGWKHGVERSSKEYETDISDLYWLNSVAETVEIQQKLNIFDDPAFNKLPGLASAFMRVVNETNEDGIDIKKLYLAQNAAGSYSSMNRIIKRYKLNYHQTSKDSPFAAGNTVDFTGYPGSITSQDEFYIIKGQDHRMAVSGTSLKNYNPKLWRDVNITDQLPIGPRITAANHLSSNVSAWGRTLAAYNSGTASKQWLVVDFNKFTRLYSNEDVPQKAEKKEMFVQSIVQNEIKHTVVHRAGKGRAKGLLWLIEQVPGLTHSADISDAFLEKTYWATYGLPFFKDIAEITHVTKMEEANGEIFSESESPRAVMFKRGYKNATSLESIIKLMRMNNITAINRAGDIKECTEDPKCILNEAGYWGVLGVRGDIVNQYKQAYGVIDTKIVSASTNNDSLDFVAISSPPFTEPVKLNATNTVVTVYTNQFDDMPTINGLEIRDLVKQQQEEEEQEKLEYLNRDVLKPFQWSESDYKDDVHQCLPDKWNFGPFKLNWSW